MPSTKPFPISWLRCCLVALLVPTLSAPIGHTDIAPEGDPDNTPPLPEQARPLETTADIDNLAALMADRRLVLMGESTHGTREYYQWRDSISRRLVANHGFSFIAVEGDFPAMNEINRYVKDLPGAARSARDILAGQQRFPAWMWSNEEFLALVEWLRSHNDSLAPGRKVGLYGMDVYNEWRALEELLAFLETEDQDTYTSVAEHYRCFDDHRGDSWGYARAVQQGAPDCATATRDAVEAIKAARDNLESVADDGYFFALQNAKVKLNAEKFYRKSQLDRKADAWNARASHMHHTVTRLLALHGEDARGIVWAHNTHIGDAHYTSMGNSNRHNIGQLSRRQWGREQVFLLGFSSHHGTVQAARAWGGQRQRMTIPPPPPESLEAVLGDMGLRRFLLLFEGPDREQGPFAKVLGHRAVGVVYHPEHDHRQFVPTIAAMRYDGLIYLHDTRALTPLVD